MLKDMLKVGWMLLVLVLVGTILFGSAMVRGNIQQLAQPAAPVQQGESGPTYVQPLPPGQSADGFAMRPIAQGLEAPLEVLEGPDGFIWVTERIGKRVTRINPETGEKRVAATIWEAHQSSGQDGVLGMVFHPEFLQGTGNDYLYLSYTYVPTDATTGVMTDTTELEESQELTSTAGTGDSETVTGTEGSGEQGPEAEDQPPQQAGEQGPEAEDPEDPSVALNFRRVKLVRYTYDPDNEVLLDPVDLLTDLPGSSDHNSAKFVFSPDNTLFYSIGDQGNNQFDRFCLPIGAQDLPTAEQVSASDWSTYVGKILRLNLDGSIPDDNPTINGVQSHIYSYGHRNVQGLALSPDGNLYATEHGPKTDDEVNLIEPGMNYGWPHVSGYQDDQAYVYGNWSAAENCGSLTFSNFEIPESVPVQQESEWNEDFVPPIYTFGTVSNDYDFQIDICDPNFNRCWPTVAPTGIEVYTPSDAIPDWPASLLVNALKTGSVFRLELSADGMSVVGDAIPQFRTNNRYRDVSISPDGSTFYVITDSEGIMQGSFGLPTSALEHPGSLLEFRYVGGE